MKVVEECPRHRGTPRSPAADRRPKTAGMAGPSRCRIAAGAGPDRDTDTAGRDGSRPYSDET